MKKIQVVVSAPVDTYSGYGARSRDFIKALVNSRPDWDVKILSQRWGQTRFGYLANHGENDLLGRIIPQLTSKPKVWIQITVPNEFQPVGEYNIGVTAGIETTLCDAEWMTGVNRMNLIITSSEHGKLVFTNTKYDQKDKQGNNVAQIQLEKPIEVLLEGVRTQVYKKVSTDNRLEIVNTLNSIDEQFCFLTVGHWLQGDYVQDRKNMSGTIEMFLQAFKGKKTKPALILKTQQASSSVMDQAKLLEKIDIVRKKVGGSNLPNIYLLHGDMQDSEINHLYNHPKVKAMISLTRGEGFGRPLLEFSVHKKPIIASAWSGHTDFLRPDLTLLVGGKLEPVHSSAVIEKMILKDSKWFEFNPDDAQKALKLVYNDYKKLVLNAKKQGTINLKHFSFDAMEAKLGEIIKNHVPEFPREVKFKMPGIKKIALPKMKTL